MELLNNHDYSPAESHIDDACAGRLLIESRCPLTRGVDHDETGDSKERAVKTPTLAAAILVFLAATALGQMHGGAAGGMSGASSTGGMGQGSMGGMRNSSGMGSMDQTGTMMTPAQRRQLMHTTPMQDQKYQSSARAMGKVQGDLSRMQSRGMGNAASSATQNTNPSYAASADTQQGAADPGDDLASDLQNLEQSNDDLASSLNSDQQAVVAGKLKDLQKKTKQMQALAEQVKSELNNPQADPKVAREHLKKLDRLSKEVAKQQHEVASALGISA